MSRMKLGTGGVFISAKRVASSSLLMAAVFHDASSDFRINTQLSEHCSHLGP